MYATNLVETSLKGDKVAQTTFRIRYTFSKSIGSKAYTDIGKYCFTLRPSKNFGDKMGEK
jgi:hypothetical protein